LRDTIRDSVGQGVKKILLNLGDVTYIDSSGIGELVSAYTTVRNQGGELKLLKLTKKVHDLLQIAKLYTVFDVKDDEAAAVKAFKYAVFAQPVRLPSRAVPLIRSEYRLFLLGRGWFLLLQFTYLQKKQHGSPPYN